MVIKLLINTNGAINKLIKRVIYLLLYGKAQHFVISLV